MAALASSDNSSIWAGSNASHPGLSINTGVSGSRRVSARPTVTGWQATTRLMPSSLVKAASCSVAPARLPSAVITNGLMPDITSRVASRATVSVLPVPGGPTISRGRSSSGRAAKLKDDARLVARSPRCRSLRSRAGTPWKSSAATNVGSTDTSGVGGPSSGSRAAVTSTPLPRRCVARINASSPSSARTCAMACAIPEAR